MKFLKKFAKILAFSLLILLAGIGIPLGGALLTSAKNRLKSADDSAKTEMVERPGKKNKKAGGDYRLN